MNAPESRRYLIGATSGHGSGACRSMGHVDDKPLVAAQMDPTLDHVAVAVAGRGDQDAAFEPAALRTQLDRLAAEIENRARIPTLVLHIFAAEILRQRQPRLGAGEAAVRARVPLHGSAASVASHADPGHVPLH